MDSKMARFDTRWTREQKQRFERASELGGFRTLSEFVFSAVQKRAEEILEQHDQLIRGAEDREIFKQALLDPPTPYNTLKQAAQRYKELWGTDELSDDSPRR